MHKIDPGDGYRLLEDGELIPQEYEILHSTHDTEPAVWILVPFPSVGVYNPKHESVNKAVAYDSDRFRPIRVLRDTQKTIMPETHNWHDNLFDKPSALPKHDGHYRTLEAKGAEPIERMEALVCRGIPGDLHRIAKRNLNMAMASKHQDRAGEKSGEAWEKELQKAENYLHRAWAGRWVG